VNNLLLFEQEVEECLIPVIKKYTEIFFSNEITLSYQFSRYGDHKNDDYKSEIEIAVIKINDGKISDYLDHIDVFIILNGKENVDPMVLSHKIENELMSILAKQL
jgi:hypothetical protein